MPCWARTRTRWRRRLGRIRKVLARFREMGASAAELWARILRCFTCFRGFYARARCTSDLFDMRRCRGVVSVCMNRCVGRDGRRRRKGVTETGNILEDAWKRARSIFINPVLSQTWIKRVGSRTHEPSRPANRTV